MFGRRRWRSRVARCAARCSAHADCRGFPRLLDGEESNLTMSVAETAGGTRSAQTQSREKLSQPFALEPESDARGTRQSAHTVRFEWTAVAFCVGLGPKFVPSELGSKDRRTNLPRRTDKLCNDDTFAYLLFFDSTVTFP